MPVLTNKTKTTAASRYSRTLIQSGVKGAELSGFKQWNDECGRRCQSFTLPYPVSANNLHQPARGGGFILTHEARVYFSQVKLLLSCSSRETLAGRLRAEVITHEADCRRRDINNCTKALFDALEASSVYLNDAQIDETLITRGSLADGEPWVEVVLVEISPLTQEQFDQDRRTKKASAQEAKTVLGAAQLLERAILATT